MPVKNYYSRNGQIEFEAVGSNVITYGRDMLGNVVAGYDNATNAVFTANYKPYGEFAQTTGNITGQRFLYCGTHGYRFSPSVPVSHYVRARHLMMRMGMWTSVDSFWPEEALYLYAYDSPSGWIDPTGGRGTGANATPRTVSRGRSGPYGGASSPWGPRGSGQPKTQPVGPKTWPGPPAGPPAPGTQRTFPGMPGTHGNPSIPRIVTFGPIDPYTWAPRYSPGDNPRTRGRLYSPECKPDPCSDIDQDKQFFKRMRGSSQCKIDPSKNLDDECGRLKNLLFYQRRICELREDELKWKCFDPYNLVYDNQGRPRPGVFNVLNHVRAWRECLSSLRTCQQIFDLHCK